MRSATRDLITAIDPLDDTEVRHRAQVLPSFDQAARKKQSFHFACIVLRYDEFLDCSNPEHHESANTPLGWSVAVLATILPLAVAALLRPLQRRLMIAAVLVASIQIPSWVWALNPSGCDWMS